jgi:Kef-type K+ transport system membrane component KefB
MEQYETPQSYANHRRYVTGFHYVLFAMLFLTFIGSFINLCKSFGTPNLYNASLVVVILIMLTLVGWYAREFALRAQDRAIRAEENLRHFAMTGRMLDSRLKMGQIVALRFASDEEFIALAKKAADENMKSDEIKKAVKNWRADLYRA